MKALILVGGYGTRLRPLTFSRPKPLVEFCNMPIVEHQIAALVKVGVTEIILAIAYKAQEMLEFIKYCEEKYKIKLICSEEKEPMGTAGPIKLAQQVLEKDNEDGLFFVFNSDVICEFPLYNIIEKHKSHGKEGTIFLTEVKEPSKYGVILSDEEGKIEQFVEKPKEYIGNRINAGIYLFNTSIIQRIPLKPTSIERIIFPQMAREGQLYSVVLKGFWNDIGQPQDYLHAISQYLEYLRTGIPKELAVGKNIQGNVIIDPTAEVHPNAVIGPNVSIGAGCIVGDGVRLQHTCLLNNVQVRDHSWINNSIIGWKSTIGKWTRIEGITVIGEDVQIKDELYLNGSIILPHKAITESIYEKGKIIM